MGWAALIGLHTLGAILWVGGMFFVLFALRPAAGILDPSQRVALFAGALSRFFAWVWLSIAVILGSGYWIVFGQYGGFATTPVHVHVMHLTGLIMVAFFAVIWFMPFARLKKAAAGGDIATAAKALNNIRLIVSLNLVLGLLTSAIGAAGAYWG